MIIRTFPVTSMGPSCSSEKILGPESFCIKVETAQLLVNRQLWKNTWSLSSDCFFVAVFCVPSSLSHKPAKMWGNYLAIMILVAGPNDPCRGIWMLVGGRSLSSMQAVVHSKSKAVKGQVGTFICSSCSQEQFSSANTTPTA